VWAGIAACSPASQTRSDGRELRLTPEAVREFEAEHARTQLD
jgi:hypothetical protein